MPKDAQNVEEPVLFEAEEAEQEQSAPVEVEEVAEEVAEVQEEAVGAEPEAEEAAEEAAEPEAEPEPEPQAKAEEPAPEAKADEPDKEVDSAPLAVVRKLREQKRQAREAQEAAEKRAAEAEARLAALNQARAKTQDEPELDPDQPLTVKEVQALLAREREAAQQAAIAAKREALGRDEAVFASEYTAEKVGEGLDYETVTMLGQENLSPNDIRTILASPTPAKTGYELCIKRTPELYELSRKAAERKKFIPQAPASKPAPAKPVVKPVVSKPQSTNTQKQQLTPAEQRALALL